MQFRACRHCGNNMRTRSHEVDMAVARYACVKLGTDIRRKFNRLKYKMQITDLGDTSGCMPVHIFQTGAFRARWADLKHERDNS